MKDGMSCYNLLILPHLNDKGGRIIHFACTYTAMWSELITSPNAWTTCLFSMQSSSNRQNCAKVVPRYEYNNLIYRVDLANLS